MSGISVNGMKPRDNTVLYKDKDPLHQKDIDARDVGTPDDWVPRHPDLVRLTGRHPFNVEPPLPALMEQGFITPASLHYVRNHGAVPKLEWDSFRLSIDGLVDAPKVFTMDDLVKMPAREIPVTLVCAGNRRKEENLRKQTIGFNWGAAGHACSVWKGVLLRDVLLECGVKTPDDGANHVCFVGAESMPKGRYGTSINWFTAMDPACDVMLAYEQNGERLTPDHGYPLRLIIPGYIGGRMIKWLTEISVTEAESDNFFHFNDNRVLPEHVTAEIANAEGWWYKPDYIINELNINSAIAYPAHQELLPLEGDGQKYTVKGYCYSGGGRKVIRVELSVDGGENWTLSKLTHPEKPTEYGKYWCWCFWELEVDVSELMMGENTELLCRGWDAAMNRQPEALTWNVMGMMNNSYFRIKVHRCLHPTTSKPALRFQHPTLAGPGNFGGWFEELSLGPAEAKS
uniref:Nitrate reductase n=1 Tax=Prymnesium polylepis TaxID=72548 RepID=A0A7S4HD63_9EUKA